MLRRLSLIAVAASLALPMAVQAQDATSSTSVNNTVAPEAVVNQRTGGGVNLNQQYNNQWDNHNGFAPGVFCRTPTMYVGGGYSRANVWGQQLNSNSTDNTGVQAGLLVPFGSSVLDDCKRLAKALTDRQEISNQVSLAKACAELEQLGVEVDGKKFPALEVCIDLPQAALESQALEKAVPQEPEVKPAILIP
jgi:hypothetical protein